MIKEISFIAMMMGVTQEQVTCLAMNMYHEARNQGVAGQLAVTSVVMNRVADKRYPDTICKVIKQSPTRPSWKGTGEMIPVRNKCQFSWYCDGKSDKVDPFSRGWQESIYIAMAVLVEKYHDPTHGATHYYNPRLANPQWAVHYEETATIGNHCFHRM